MNPSFLWEDYYQLAVDLEKDSSKQLYEARGRTIVSRAYYAALITTRDFLRNKYPEREYRDSVHTQVARDIAIGKYSGVSIHLKTLKPFRDDCDYSTHSIQNIDLLIRDALTRAKKVIEMLKT